MDNRVKTAVVVGAGPVGCLAALSLAKMGWQVEIYESRPDMRLPSSKASLAQRSINLAISSRGIAALTAVDSEMAARFLDTVIPMRGRMIHDLSGKQESQLYDVHGECINSIDRALLNEGLLNEVASIASVRVFFQHKLATADFDNRSLVFQTGDGSKEISFDFCVGADGGYSNVRRQMMRFVRVDFQQQYITHEYIELRMPPGCNEQGQPTFQLDPNHLHIWPRHSFMLIALPNKDKSFTCTLFAPTEEFERLRPSSFNSIHRGQDSEDISSRASVVLQWFNKFFPDAVPLIGQTALLRDFLTNPRSSPVCVKAKPYHYRDRVILLGDAAHAMTPFFGQGLNCGLEDVRVLSILMRQCGVDASTPSTLSSELRLPQNGMPNETNTSFGRRSDGMDDSLARALELYTDTRHEDLIAISDMAMDNYLEMRHHVTTLQYRSRKILDEFLYKLMPYTPTQVLVSSLEEQTFNFTTGGRGRRLLGWFPLYTMVTFRPDISYGAVKRKAEMQSRVMSSIGWLGLTGGVALLIARIVHRMKK